jgi:hypothetical protein
MTKEVALVMLLRFLRPAPGMMFTWGSALSPQNPTAATTAASVPYTAEKSLPSSIQCTFFMYFSIEACVHVCLLVDGKTSEVAKY